MSCNSESLDGQARGSAEGAPNPPAVRGVDHGEQEERARGAIPVGPTDPMNPRRTILGATLLISLCLAGTARADPTKADDQYGYVFKDDILAADGSIVTAVPIYVQKHKRREVLLRPRVQFVTEMLKSVETL